MKRRIPILILVLAVAAAAIYFAATRRPHRLMLTGVVTTDDVIVAPEVQGRLQHLFVQQGDTVTNGQLLAVIQPQEWQADLAFYANTEEQWAAQVNQAKADLSYQEAQTSNQIRQAEANLAATRAQVTQAAADLEIARLNFQREEDLYKRGVDPVQSFDQARTTKEGAAARVESLRKQVQAAEAAVALAQANADQVAARRAALQATKHQYAAAEAQKDKARVRLNYTEIHAPLDAIVDLRAARQGEVVSPGQPIVTLINQDNLWVRADVEETYIEHIPIGARFDVRFPSGAVRTGTVFYRGIDADYATQRDVSRTKRDIKTFEVRLRCDNADRRLAVGMTAYVILDLTKP
jgi:HlyD family secretion protein